MTTITNAPTAPAPTTAPAPVVPPPPAPAPVPPPAPAPAPAPVAASRRSVYLLAAAVGCLMVAGLLYVLVDRPGLRDPLAALATIVTPLVGVAGFVWGASRASQ
ncbi:hypothetical protein [Streptomyces sp. ADI98-10]|uniref:hypothetical protein n=1 Tax=Streptomyces sp. ADI98-10 TaxID=1522763 RepID=UPI000F91C47B|nr:hypothetical protein [Streptomyces sp. ADI98-10]RPK77935.1 hypothetical protein EES46_34630 [Streptomyces sp. ADI98-10]